MNVWELPQSIEVAGTEYEIRTDYRAVLDILCAFADPDLENDEKWEICLSILFVDFEDMPRAHYLEASRKARAFIDMGQIQDDKKVQPRLMDWEQDAQLIVPAVNKVIGQEVRAIKYMHWWTFLSAYMEIGECSYSHILNIRQKKAKGKPLEKWEQEYIRENKDIVLLKDKLTEEEIAEQQLLEEIFG